MLPVNFYGRVEKSERGSRWLDTQVCGRVYCDNLHGFFCRFLLINRWHDLFHVLGGLCHAGK